MGGLIFGWLAVWVPSPDWLCRILKLCEVCQELRWSRRTWGRGCAPCPVFAKNTLAFPLQLRKITENHSQGNRRAFGCSAPNAIHLVDLARRLLFSVALGFRFKRRGQPSFSVSFCRVAVLGGSPHQLTFSQSSNYGRCF